MTTRWQVLIDWNNDGAFTGVYEDVTPYLLRAHCQIGSQDYNYDIAAIGTATLTLNNLSRIFSPENTSGPLYGELLPRLPVKIQAIDDTTGSTYPLWWGYTKTFTPESGTKRSTNIDIGCEDRLAILDGYGLDIPLQLNKTTDALIRICINQAFLAAVASQTVTLTGNPANNDTLTINGVTLTFKTTLSGGNNEILIGAANTDTANNLYAGINGGLINGSGSGTLYAATIDQNIRTAVWASVSSNVVTLTSMLRGAVGNSIALAKSSANITLGGSALSGGADAPSGAISLDVGALTVPYAGDNWTQESTTALKAIQDTTLAEWGYFYQDRSGNLTLHNRNWIFKQVAASVSLNTDNVTDAAGQQALEDVYNLIKVVYTPRSTLSSGVLGKTSSSVQVPGLSGSDRWSGTVVLPGGGVTTFKLPFIDPTTKREMGGQSIILPPVASTDWTANEQSDGSGVSYTGSNVLSFSVALAGSGADVTVKNTALGPLYITSFQLRGTGIVSYDSVIVASEDSTSEAAYGKRILPVELALQLDGNTALALSQYLLSKYKNPKHRLRSIRATHLDYLGGTNLYSLEIGQMITVSDYQTGVSNHRYLVIGMEYDRDQNGSLDATLYLERLDDVTYGILDDTVYGKLDSTARCAI